MALNFLFNEEDDKVYLDDLLDYLIIKKKLCEDLKKHIEEYLFEYIECNICKKKYYEDDITIEYCYECENIICNKCCEVYLLEYKYIDNDTFELLDYNFKYKEFCLTCLNNKDINTEFVYHIDNYML